MFFSLPISYKWKRNGERAFVPGTSISDRGRVLTIVNAPLDAEGGYICTANGKAGVAHKTISVVMESMLQFIAQNRFKTDHLFSRKFSENLKGNATK